MKTKTVQETVTRTVYVAEDGKEFSCEKECRKHEIEINERICEERANSLPQIEIDYPHSFYYTYTWYLVSSPDDFNSILMSLYDEDERAFIDCPDIELPAWILFAHDEGHGCPLGTLEQVEKELTGYISDVKEAMQRQ